MTMISRCFAISFCSVCLYAFGAGEAVAQTWQGPLAVTQLFPPDATRSCAFFQLKGVTQADPAFPRVPWFALPMSNVGFHEQYALLLTAALNNHPISAATVGQSACGFAQVVYVSSAFP